MKLAIVGSRTGMPREKVFGVLYDFQSKNKIELVISGGAKGVDTFAIDWAKKNNIKWNIIYPDWTHFGKPAGAIRNQKIVDQCDEIMIFWDGQSKGTKITLRMVEKAKKTFHLHIGGKHLQAVLDLLEQE